MDISVFGLGYVGCVSLGCLGQQGHNVIGVDINQEKVDLINSGKATIVEKDIDQIINEQVSLKNINASTDFFEAVLNSDVSIIAVGTPSSENGKLNMSYIYRVAENIGNAIKHKKTFHTVVIRSTVIPGTAEKAAKIIEKNSDKTYDLDFTIVVNPEFLREGTSIFDYYNPPITVIGFSNLTGAKIISSIYKKLPGELILVDIRTAEILKYVNNSFHALKIAFANEVGNVCKELSIDSHRVMEILCKDKKLNISPYYLKPGFAYGGSCLPKDLKAFQKLANDSGLDSPLINSISKSNNSQIKKSINLIKSFKIKKVAFLGISFKAGTDDLRNSPTLNVINELLKDGFKISIYDKNVQKSKLIGADRTFFENAIPEISNLIHSNLAKVISESDLIVVSNKEKEFKEAIKELDKKTIIDLVYIGDNIKSKKNYFGLSW
jgi:GDP-mannose 6-dehydrogenase